MQAHLTLLWSNMSLRNADGCGRPSFPDPDATRDQTQTPGKKVSAYDRPIPELILSMALWVSESGTHSSVVHFFLYKLRAGEISILEGREQR